MQVGVVGELLLGEVELVAAGFDGEAESCLEGRGGGHRLSLSGAGLPVDDIAVDMLAYIPLWFRSYDIAVEQASGGRGGEPLFPPCPPDESRTRERRAWQQTGVDRESAWEPSRPP